MKTPMKKSTKVILITVAALLLILAAAGGIWLVNQKLSQDEYTKQMKNADKYLANKDYDKAILAYEKAIQADPGEAGAYEEIAQIYISLSNVKKAEYYLNLGIKKASDTGRLRFMLKKVLGSTDAPAVLTEDKNEEEEVEEEEGTQYKVSGVIVDAVTGKGVADANITAALAKESGNGETAENGSARSKASGSYELKLGAGKYNVMVRKDGYIEETFSLEVKDKELKNQNFTISPELGKGEIRIVLDWGASPRDLDAYLFADSVQNSYPVYFGDKGSQSKGAMLDIDDRDGYGPETITIYDTSRTWIYGVQDFTDSHTGLGRSQAQVKVYIPGQEPKVYTPPAGEGDYWTVCRIANGTVSDIGYLGGGFRE